MDPASILGTTSAVISFIDFIGKCLSTARELNDAQGTIREYQRLGELTSALDWGLIDLRAGLGEKKRGRGNNSTSNAEESLLRVLEQCMIVEQDIRKLANLQVEKRPKSQPWTSEADKLKNVIRYAFRLAKVSIHAVWTKPEAEGLKREFSQCTSLLNIHLCLIMR